VSCRHIPHHHLAVAVPVPAVLLHDTGLNRCNRWLTLYAYLQHPKLQEHVKQILPQLLRAAISKGCRPWGREAGDTPASDLHELLRLPAAQNLPAAVVKQVMQHSIKRMDGALLSVLVRLPAAAQLQQDDVAVLLQAALGHCEGQRPGCLVDLD
jgi:hypothetical protein